MQIKNSWRFNIDLLSTRNAITLYLFLHFLLLGIKIDQKYDLSQSYNQITEKFRTTFYWPTKPAVSNPTTRLVCNLWSWGCNKLRLMREKRREAERSYSAERDAEGERGRTRKRESCAQKQLKPNALVLCALSSSASSSAHSSSSRARLHKTRACDNVGYTYKFIFITTITAFCI